MAAQNGSVNVFKVATKCTAWWFELMTLVALIKMDICTVLSHIASLSITVIRIKQTNERHKVKQKFTPKMPTVILYLLAKVFVNS